MLPEGSTLRLDAETLIVNITAAPTAEELEAELAEAEAEAGIEHEPRPRRGRRGRAPRHRPRPPRAPRRGVRRVSRRMPMPSRRSFGTRQESRHGRTTAGWSSGWATPARRTPAPAQRRLPRRRRAGRPDGRLAGRPTSPAAPTSSRAGSAGMPGIRAWCSAGRARYMNESGGPVIGAARRSTRCRAERVVVVHDELDIPFGTCGSSSAAATTATTGCKSMRRRSAPATSTGCGSGSAGRRGRQETGRLRARDYTAAERANSTSR